LIVAVLLFLAINDSLQAYNPTLALEMAHVSGMSYCKMDAITSMTCGQHCNALKGKVNWLRYYNKPTIGGDLSYGMYVDHSNKLLIVAFRGTNTVWQLTSEIATSFDVDYKLHNIPKAVVAKYFYDGYKNNLRSDMQTYLKKYYASYPSYQVVFTGHSLGGALCTHAALDAVMSGIVSSSKVMVYNFGSPRVGNYAFASKVKELIPNFYRITHRKDLVPHVPPCRIGLNGKCITGEGNIDYTLNLSPIWYAWHVAGEVHYTDDSHYTTACSGGEDPKCSDQYALTACNTDDHNRYLGLTMGGGGCAAGTAFWE